VRTDEVDGPVWCDREASNRKNVKKESTILTGLLYRDLRIQAGVTLGLLQGPSLQGHDDD